MNKIVTVERVAGFILDEHGGEVPTWETFATVWASVYPLKGRELIAAQAVQSELTVVFELRYLAGITSDMRILYDGKYYGLDVPVDPQERHQKIQVMGKCL